MTVLVLAKAPEAGRVKTRLCPPCTSPEAAAIAAAALADTLDAAAAAADRVVLALDGRMSTPPGVTTVPQRDGALGDRIAAAFCEAGPGPVLQIGMDTPQAHGWLLASCLSELDSSVDAVLGPAEDGGWWALGLHDPRQARLLGGVPMSTSDTGRRTLAALRNAGLRVRMLPKLRDVDEWADALAVAELAPTGRFAAAVAAVAARVPA